MNEDLKYSYIVVRKMLKDHIADLDAEIQNLDPSATWELQIISAQLKGLLGHMEKQDVK